MNYVFVDFWGEVTLRKYYSYEYNTPKPDEMNL